MNETVWPHIRENDGGTHILTWHLDSQDAPGTLCGESTHDMEVVTEPGRRYSVGAGIATSSRGRATRPSHLSATPPSRG